MSSATSATCGRPWRSAGSAWRRAACCCSAWNAARHATRRGRDGGWDRPAVTPMRRTTSPPAWPRPGCRRWNAGRKCCAATARRPSPACWWRRMRPATEGSLWPAGLAALAGGAPAAAVPLLAEATAAGEGGGLAPLNLGLALMQLGRLAEAVPALEAAARALPDHAEPPFRLGTIAGLRGEGEQAEMLFRAALERDPRHVPALAALAALDEEAGRFE